MVCGQAKKLGERKSLYLGISITILGLCLYMPFGPGHPKLWLEPCFCMATIHHHRFSRAPTSDDDVVVGCNDKWCATLPALPFYQMIFGMVLGELVLIHFRQSAHHRKVAIGYPMAAVMVFSIYSKLLGAGKQGVWMGFVTAAGSTARTLGMYGFYLFSPYLSLTDRAADHHWRVPR